MRNTSRSSNTRRTTTGKAIGNKPGRIVKGATGNKVRHDGQAVRRAERESGETGV